MQSTVCSGLSLCKRGHVNVGLYFQSSGSIIQNLIKLLSLWRSKIWGGKAERGLFCYMVLTLELCKCLYINMNLKRIKINTTTFIKLMPKLHKEYHFWNVQFLFLFTSLSWVYPKYKNPQKNIKLHSVVLLF